MLSWPGWLNHSGQFTHISGHPSATGRAQDRESTPAEDRRSTAVPRNQPNAFNEDKSMLCRVTWLTDKFDRRNTIRYTIRTI